MGLDKQVAGSGERGLEVAKEGISKEGEVVVGVEVD